MGLMVFLLLGGGGAGGYWYFAMGAQWPLPFMKGSPGLSTGQGQDGQSPVTAATDTLPLVASNAADSAASDSLPTPPDSAAPVTTVPDYGILVVRGLPRGTQVKVDGNAIQGDSVEVRPGSHKIEVERLGYNKFETTLAVRKGEKVVLPVTLTKLPVPKPVAKPVDRPVEPVKPAADLCEQDPPSPEYFSSGTCYDTAPSLTVLPVLTLPSGAGAVPGPTQLFVKVSPEGKSMRVVPGRRVRPSLATIAAVNFADTISYTPATKDGKPVEAWLRLLVRFLRQ